ncbi:MAG: GlsB/YeaQ/YmgE family stress response membrane protein, partial [Rhizomicrobium sp.]
GLIAGFVASKVVNARGEGCFLNIALGLVGAMVGGFLMQTLGGDREGGFLYSTVVAIIGAIIVLAIWHAVTGRRTLR